MRKEAVVICSELLIRFSPIGTDELPQNSWNSGGDSNQEPPEYKSTALPLCRTFSLETIVFYIEL
jgi:hypothetical protein